MTRRRRRRRRRRRARRLLMLVLVRWGRKGAVRDVRRRYRGRIGKSIKITIWRLTCSGLMVVVEKEKEKEEEEGEQEWVAARRVGMARVTNGVRRMGTTRRRGRKGRALSKIIGVAPLP
jgi:hypothetical protein